MQNFGILDIDNLDKTQPTHQRSKVNHNYLRIHNVFSFMKDVIDLETNHIAHSTYIC